MEAFLISTGLVAIAEIGDKTMLLSIVMAATWRRPAPIILGILAATLLNHAFAALAGTVLAAFVQGEWMRWIVGVAFLGFAVWALIPDTLEEQKADVQRGFRAIFWTTASAFFVIEMGDKTQVATAMLAARFEDLALVVAGSTLGMMLVNGPAVLLGETAAKKLPLKWIRLAAAAGFAATGLWILLARWGLSPPSRPRTGSAGSRNPEVRAGRRPGGRPRPCAAPRRRSGGAGASSGWP